MTFKELEVGDRFKCVKDKGSNMVYIKHPVNTTKYLHDNATCITKHIECYVPNNTLVIKVEDDNANETDPIL